MSTTAPRPGRTKKELLKWKCESSPVKEIWATQKEVTLLSPRDAEKTLERTNVKILAEFLAQSNYSVDFNHNFKGLET